MKQAILPILAFLTVCLLSAFIAWCTGYDFDQRGNQLAFGVFMTTLFASMAAAGTFAARKL